ncbi:MAG: hypothetical protein R8M38_01680 [Mariprofundaceae bacterium]
MPRQKAHITTHNRQMIWADIRARKVFTSHDLLKSSQLGSCTIRSYLRSLLIAGFIEKKGDSAKVGETIVYELMKDCGVDAPRLRSDGSRVTLGDISENLWRTMRILGDFSTVDLIAAASTEEVRVSVNSAQSYCRTLAQAGYLATLPKAPGFRMTRYRLLPSKHTGARPPQVQRTKALFDPNLGKVVWREEVQDV